MALSNKKSPNSQPYRMLILAPYDGFEIMINKVIADRKDILADVYQAPVDHVEAVLSGLNLNKYEVVICRGRSSYIASQIVDLPVVTVEFSPMDLSGFVSYREPPELSEDLRLVNSVSSLSKLLTENM